MRVYAGSELLDGAARGCVLTIGNFDGLHLGHQALLGEVIARARAGRHLAVAYIFDPHPRLVLDPSARITRLMTREQLEHGLRQLGIDVLILEPFTRQLASLAPEEFVENILAQRIGPSALLVGRDFRFGQGRSGSDDLLEQLGPRFGFQVSIIGQVLVDGEDVSSTRIRRWIAQGEVGEARRQLGRPYSVWGRVVRGDARGRTLGFPTANLEPENELLPAHGVYATTVQIFKDRELSPEAYPSVTNVGRRPTFGGSEVRVETHLLDRDVDLYGARLAVQFWHRVREERRFAGPDALRLQIAADCVAARELLTAV